MPTKVRQARLKDVAALAEVSVASASQALGGGPVGAETRRKVLEAAQQLSYVPHTGARELRTGTPLTIGMWVLHRPDAEELTENNSFYYTLIRGALDELDRAGHSFDFQVSDHPRAGEPGSMPGAVLSGRYRGLILIPQWHSTGAYLHEIERTGVPYVTVNEPRASRASVGVDNAAGIGLALGHLQRAGHSEIAYLAGPEGHLDAEERLAAYYRHAARAGMRVREEWVLRAGFSIEEGRARMQQLLGLRTGRDDGPTAVLAANDYVAAGAMRACAEAGVRIPDDVSLVGFDDVDVARATVPALTTVRQPLRELGSAAAQAVLALAAGKARASIVLRPELVERDSVSEA